MYCSGRPHVTHVRACRCPERWNRTQQIKFDVLKHPYVNTCIGEQMPVRCVNMCWCMNTRIWRVNSFGISVLEFRSTLKTEGNLPGQFILHTRVRPSPFFLFSDNFSFSSGIARAFWTIWYEWKHPANISNLLLESTIHAFNKNFHERVQYIYAYVHVNVIPP